MTMNESLVMPYQGNPQNQKSNPPLGLMRRNAALNVALKRGRT
jgi:hypothetical protein